MSACIFLVNYELDSDGAYIDSASDLIEFVTVPSDLFLSLLDAKQAVKSSQLQVFEDESKCASFQINCFLPDEVLRLKERVREVFLDELQKSALHANLASTKNEELDFLDATFSTFKVLTNLDALLTRKLKIFSDDQSIVVRVNTNE